MAYRYLRSEVKTPTAQLNHINCEISFFEDRVEASETLFLTARETLEHLMLNAKELEIIFCSLPYEYDRSHHLITVKLPKPANPGDGIEVSFKCITHPSETVLDGIYRDTTPPGDHPQQYMSQCEQWGFQRIMPVIDDCTAKCTFKTVIEGDERYTHLISNGNITDVTTSNGRRRVTFENKIPMAPYLFIACAGTWDSLEDALTLPNGKTIKLEYLVPPGKKTAATIPMEILKRSILWQHQTIGFNYPYDTYRTISMEKSNFGGMENVGNTTIIAEAATIDDTLPDSRLAYAFSVIVHEYEHSHCGSGVTMASPFDMWLNEAYTVTVEQNFTATVFNPVFQRVRDTDALRSITGGPLSEEDTGRSGQIVREGFNDPDEVVDGVTYDKAPEVLRMLERILGAETYRRATELYFKRYDGGNANTDQFLDCVDEIAQGRLDVKRFADSWLFHAGYPIVETSWKYDAENKLFRLTLRQRPNLPGAKAPFIMPFAAAAVDAQWNDIFNVTLILDKEKAEFDIPCDRAPAFASLNRGYSFYGRCFAEETDEEKLSLQALHDPDEFNRVQAMRALVDIDRARYLAAPDGFEPSQLLLSTVKAVNDDTRLSDAAKGFMLSVQELPLDTRLMRRMDLNAKFRKILLKAYASRIDYAASLESGRRSKLTGDLIADIAASIPRRALNNAYAQIAAAADTRDAHIALKRHLLAATNITERLQTLAALWSSSSPDAYEALENERTRLCKSLTGKIGYFSIIGQKSGVEAVDAVCEAEKLPEFSITHPGIRRALYMPLIDNNSAIWTERGMQWFAQTVIKVAGIGEYAANRMLDAVQNYRSFDPAIAGRVETALRTIQSTLDKDKNPWIRAKVDSFLS